MSTKKNTTKAAAAVKSAADKLNAKAERNTQAKETAAAVSAIGSGSRAAVRLKTAAAAKRNASPLFRFILDNYCKGNAVCSSEKSLATAKIPAETAVEFLFRSASLYAAAAHYAEASKGGTAEAVKATRNTMFTEWKAYLAALSGETVKACGADENSLFRAVVAVKKEGTAFTAVEREDGTASYRMSKGVAFDTIVSKTAFFKAVERLAVERILGIDGVVSIDAAKAARVSTAAAKSKEKSRFEKSVELESKADKSADSSESTEVKAEGTAAPAADTAA